MDEWGILPQAMVNSEAVNMCSPMKGQRLDDGEFSSTYSDAGMVRVILK